MAMDTTEAGLPAPAAVGPFDPGDDRDPKLLAGVPALAVEHVALQECEETLHRCVVPARSDFAHRPRESMSVQGVYEFSRSELGAFNRSMQHWVVVASVVVRQRLRREFSIQGLF